MTLERLLDMARETVDADADCTPGLDPSHLEVLFADGIIKLVGESTPIGIEEPPIVSLGNGECGVLVDDRQDALTVDELRGYAAMLLRVADKAGERNR